MDDDKTREVLTALLDEMRQSKIQLSDVLAQRSEYAADIKDLKAAIDTTRRALDPEQLGQYVADNNNAFMGNITDKFARALNANAERDQELRHTSKDLQAQATRFSQETTFLNGLAARLEERDAQSKWDVAALAAAMIVAAGLASAAAYCYAYSAIVKNDFDRSVKLISQDDDAKWCGFAQAPIIQDKNGVSYCAIAMPEYQGPEGD